MAIATLHALGRIRGRVGNLVFRQCGGRTIVSKYNPPPKRKITTGQLEVRLRFQMAATYARAALADPAGAAFYAQLATAKKKPVFAIAVGDYFKAPEIRLIDAAAFNGHAGDMIGVLALDDAGVTRVMVTLKDMTGTVLEQGWATGDGSCWDYRVQKPAPPGQPLTIEASAFDRPHNTATKTVPWVPPTVTRTPTDAEVPTCRVIT